MVCNKITLFRICAAIIILVIPSKFLVAQNNKLDSFKATLPKSPDSLKVEILLKIGWEYKNMGIYDETLSHFYQALHIAEDINDNESIFRSLYNISNFYTGQNNYELAIEYGERAQKIAELQTNKENLYKIYDLIGGYIYFNQGNFTKSFEYGYKMLKIVQDLKDTLRIRDMKQWFGDTYRNAKKPDSAILMYKIAMDISGQLKDKEKIAYCLQGIGMAESQKNNYKESINYFLQAIDIGERENFSTSNFTLNAADSYFKLRKFKEAESFAKASIKSYTKENDKQTIQFLYHFLSQIYIADSNYLESYKYQTYYLELKDSLNSDATQNKIGTIENKYKSEKQNKEIGFLQKQASLQKKLQNTLIISSILLIVVAFMIYNKYRHKKKAEVILNEKNSDLTQTLNELKATQLQLIQSEKMASLGELTAGIAHEIQNPLNFVNNFSEVNVELIEEMVDEVKKGNASEAEAIANDIKQNLEKINHHGKRADAIVKGMLQHSRSSSGQKEPTDINALCDEYLRLSYHGLRAKDKSFNATLKTDYDERIDKINVMPQDVGRVLLNLLNNAFYAVAEKKNLIGLQYEPIISISTKKINNKVEIKIADNGNGIPSSIKDKIFQPFFTTKPTGQGTGLGLSLSYDIITKAHGGEISSDTKEGEGTTFSILLHA